MILDSDQHIKKELDDQLPITDFFLESVGFKYLGSYGSAEKVFSYRRYKYNKGHYGCIEIKFYNTTDTPFILLSNVNDLDGLNFNRVLIYQGQVKNYIKYRKMKSRIAVLEHQSEDIIKSFPTVDQVIDLWKRTKK